MAPQGTNNQPFLLKSCNEADQTQLWALYEVIPSPPANAGSASSPLSSLSSALSVSQHLSAPIPTLLYNLGAAAALQINGGSALPGNSLIVAASGSAFQFELSAVTCSSTNLGTCSPVLNSASFASPLSNQPVSVGLIGQNCHLDTSFPTQVGSFVGADCTDTLVRSNEAFYFLPSSVFPNVYQIQGLDLSYGILCAAAVPSPGLGTSMEPCDGNSTMQLWALYEVLPSPPVNGGSALTPQISVYDAVSGSSGYSGTYLYNLGFGGVVQSINTGYSIVSLQTAVSTSDITSQMIFNANQCSSLTSQVSCPRITNLANFASSGQTVSITTAASESGTNCHLNHGLVPSAGSTVTTNCDGVPQTSEVNLFIPSTLFPNLNVYLIQVTLQSQTTNFCIAPQGVSKQAMIVKPCDQNDPSQLWAIYGTISSPPANAGSSLSPLATLSSTLSSSSQLPIPIVLYNLGYGGALQSASTPRSAVDFNIIPLNSAVTAVDAQFNLNAVTCNSNLQGSCSAVSNPSSFLSPLSNQQVSVGFTVQNSCYLNIWGGVSINQVGALVQTDCSDPVVGPNEAFTFVPNSLLSNVYQIQGLEANNGVVCVTAQGASNQPLVLELCDVNTPTQMWSIYSIAATMCGNGVVDQWEQCDFG